MFKNLKDHILTIPTEVMDVFDGPDQVCEQLCHKCRQLTDKQDAYRYDTHVWFHTNCFNRYEHYYGLDKPID